MVNLLLSLNNFDENWCYSILKNIINPLTTKPQAMLLIQSLY